MAIPKLVITRLDGTEVIVTPNLGDTLNFERTLRNNPKWGSLQENTLKMGPFRAWSAGKREGTITETWEEFANAVAEVSRLDEDATAGDEDDALGLGTAPAAHTTY